MLAQTERLQDRGLLALACSANANVFRVKGDWLSAREYLDRGLNLEPRQSMILSYMALTEYETGNFLQGKTYVEQLLEVMRATTPGPTGEYHFPAWVIPVVCRISGVVDGLDISREAAQVVLSSPYHKPIVASLRVGNALIAVLENDVTGAKERYDDLLQRRIELAASNIAVGMPSIHRVLGLLAHTSGNLDQAVAHYEDSLDLCRKAGYRPELAWTCCDYSDMLLERNNDGDEDKARTLLDESLAISTELGMRPLMERVAGLQEQAEAQPVRAPAYPDGLTQREVEVIRLVATGKTDREIAEELIISVNTVGNHVRSILNKTDSANRTEAAGYATRHGFTGNSGDDD